MQKISDYILKLSPIKIAIYLIIFPLIFALLHTVLTIIQRANYDFSEVVDSIIPILLTVILGILIFSMFIWFFWLRATTFSVEDSKIGLPIKWFHLAFVLFLFYVSYNLFFSFFETTITHNFKSNIWIFYAIREVINFAGLLIFYPIICHYSARAVFVHREDKVATFKNSILYTLLIIFIPISIPFLHNYISPVKTKINKLFIVYGIGLLFVIVIFFIALIASISGVF